MRLPAMSTWLSRHVTKNAGHLTIKNLNAGTSNSKPTPLTFCEVYAHGGSNNTSTARYANGKGMINGVNTPATPQESASLDVVDYAPDMLNDN